ncbi:uncharacterized protein LOC128863360 [Anastrepha ludens]|uniref:uncharacterized protein LOC128863360 n=1 Tax=Anastrepha ludens TaxID=28586 RepID=UPI0023B0FC1F|nr:uncharacterized protein LOC128863360 [Anastrepha ludens]
MYSEDEMHPPEWISEDFFKQILDKAESESVKIINMQLSPGTVKNDNYASVLFRAKLKYVLCAQPAQEKCRSFIMKTGPIVDGIRKDKMSELPLFETEVKMYTKVLPKIEAELRAIGDETVLSPKLFHYSLEWPQCIVLEDLVLEGYTTINNRPCNLDEIKVALQKLAKLHAISFKMAKMGNDDVTTLDNHFMNTLDLETFPLLRDGVKLTKEIISDVPDLQEYLPHIQEAERFLLPKVLELVNSYKNGRHSGVQVLNHGDFHVKNVMVKNVNNQLKDLILIDYQLSIFGSPAIDLHYAFTLFYSPDMRREKMDELLYHYITHFQETLRRAKYQGHIPTITELRAELQEFRHWGLYMNLTLLILNYAFVDDSIELSKMVESETDRRAYFANSKILNELRVLLPRFLYFGYFEE